jgi:hypothetical protein
MPGEGVVIGVVVSHDHRRWADSLAEELPELLSDHVDPDAKWSIEVEEAGPADASASPSDLTGAVRRRTLDRGWEMGIGLTGLPLRVDRRPVATYASGSHAVGLVSIPALGLRLGDRLNDAVVELVGGLRDGTARSHSAKSVGRRRADAERHGIVRFAGLAILGNLRLLAGMIRANQPTRVMSRLSRSAAAALGTGAYALISTNVWALAHEGGWPRLLAIALLSLAMILFAMVFAHGLWERARDTAARERIVLFNVVTVVTLAIGICALYLALFAVLLGSALVAIPPGSLRRELGSASLGEYARLAWLAASIATVGGALGSLLESDEAVREATYRRTRGRDGSQVAEED